MYTQDYDGMYTPPFHYNPMRDARDWTCPDLDWWDDLLQPYVKNRQLAVCPSIRFTTTCAAARNLWFQSGATMVKAWSYGVNTVESWPLTRWNPLTAHGFRDPNFRNIQPLQVGRSVSEAVVADPANTIWLMDSNNIEMWNEGLFDYFSPAQRARFERHNQGFNAAFADGHVKWIRAGSTRPCQWSVQSDCP